MVLSWIAARYWPALGVSERRLDARMSDWLASITPAVVLRASEWGTWMASPWLWRVVRWATIAVLVVTRRVRHLVVLGIVLLGVTTVANLVEGGRRVSPAPAPTVVALGASLVGAMYTLVPRGRLRNRAKLVAGAVLAAMVIPRLLQGDDGPAAVAAGLLLGVAVPMVAFRWLAPNELFPITYDRDHRPRVLDQARLDAIRAALANDYGWELIDLRLLRPPGSSGSTPMQLSVRSEDGAEPVDLFAKLYSLSHLRSDRWYKLARAVLYGRLEDEAPFTDIRQLVEHEDYLLRLAADAGLPVPKSFGISELTPGREYLLVMEHLAEAEQLGPDLVTESVIDQGLAAVHDMWRSGLAHRDIKPANLVVSRGRLYLVDLSFGEVKASAWREAVDLATMMLSLSLYADPALVYRRATRRFDPHEIAEAFAAAGSVTIPRQLRLLLREGAPDLRDRFRSMAPPHTPIAMQRWSYRRVALAAASLTAIALAGFTLAFNLEAAGLL